MKVFGNGYGFVIGSVSALKALVNAFKARVLADSGTFEGEANLLNQKIADINAASFVYIPSSYKVGIDYSIKGGDLTHSRSSVAFRNNASNVLEQMAANVGRVSYVGGVPTLLVEPARTNSITFSEDYTNASWVKGNCTITANAGIAPSGANTAQLFNEGSTSANHSLSKGGIIFVAGNYIIYQIIKSVNRNFVGLGSANANIGNIFNLTNNTVTSNLFGGSLTNPFCIDHPSGNGWKIIGGQTNNPNNISFFIFAAINGTTVNYQGTNQNCYLLAGSQCELGLYATSYIRTTASTVTRVADNFNVNISSFCSRTQGTLVLKVLNNIAYMPDTAQAQQFGIGSFALSGATADNIWVGQSSNNRLLIWKQIAGVLTPIFTTTQASCNLAIKWDGVIIEVFQNGVKVVSSEAFVPTNNFTTLGIAGQMQVPLSISYKAIYNSFLSDTDCIAITS